jgi:hypothetical protein
MHIADLNNFLSTELLCAFMNQRTEWCIQIPYIFCFFTIVLNSVRHDVQPASSLLLVSIGEESFSSN